MSLLLTPHLLPQYLHEISHFGKLKVHTDFYTKVVPKIHTLSNSNVSVWKLKILSIYMITQFVKKSKTFLRVT